MPHISIKPETIFTLLGLKITNSLLLSVLVLVFFIVVSLLYSYQATRQKKGTFFFLVTLLLRTTYNFFKSIFGENVDYFFPLVGAFFFFILLQNWSGLIPGSGSLLIKVSENQRMVFAPLFRANTADLNTTLSLALISVIFSQYVGIKFLGAKEYLKKFINFKNPIVFFTGLMDTISELSKIISFSFRLFGNIFAGEVIIVIIAFLVPVLLSFPFLLFEVFIGLIQALVFAMLSAIFFNLAIQKAH